MAQGAFVRVTVYTIHGDKISGETTGALESIAGDLWLKLQVSEKLFVKAKLDAIYAMEYETNEIADDPSAEGHPLFSLFRFAEAPPESPAPGSDSEAP